MIGAFYSLYGLGQLVTPSLAVSHTRQRDALNVLDWVDPLIGSRSGGNVFAGATLPYGMAKGPGGQ